MSRLARSVARIFAAFCLCAGGAMAQPAITDHVTPGGLSFRYAHMPEEKNQAINFGWRDGYALGHKAGHGLAIFGPALIMQGPKGLARSEFVEDIKDLQTRMGLSSSLEHTSGGLTAPVEKFGESIDLFARVLRDPAMDPERLNEMRSQYLPRLKQAGSNPATMGNHVGAHMLYPEGALRDWQLNSPAVFEHVTVDAINDWRKAVLVREGLLITAAGKATPDEAAVQIDKLFAGLPQKGEAFAKGQDIAKSQTQKLISGKTILRIADVPQTFLLVGGWSGFRSDDNLVYSSMITSIMTARLFKSIREKLGATYGASAQLVTSVPEPFIFSMSAAVSHEKGPEALAELKREVEALLDKGVTSEELEPEKSKFTSQMRESFRHAGAVSGLLLNGMLTNRRSDTVQTSLQRIAAVTAEGVNAAIKTHLKGTTFGTVIVTPSATAFPADCIVKVASEAAGCQ